MSTRIAPMSTHGDPPCAAADGLLSAHARQHGKETTTSTLIASTEPAERAARPAILPTVVGLVLALAGPFLFQRLVAPRVLEPRLGPLAHVLVGQTVLWLLAGTVIAVAVRWERQPLAALGLRRLAWRSALAAALLGVALGAAVPVLTLAVNRLLPSAPGATWATITDRAPAWVWLLLVLTASVTEEVFFRAYPFERLARLTGRLWPGALLALAAFVAYHISPQGWSLVHVVGVVLPKGAIFTALYAWRRNLPFVVIAHLLVDLPLFLIALGVLPVG